MKRKITGLLALSLLFSLTGQVFASSRVNKEVAETAQFLYQTVDQPNFGTMAGEWTVLSLARSGERLPDGYLDNYYKRVEAHVQAKNGDLSKNKFTEYSRIICALTAIGKDPRNVAGHDLVKPLSNFNSVIKQGLNGPIWALIALDTRGYDLSPIEPAQEQNSRDRMIGEILRREVKGGGWNLMGDKADPDMTAMALYALAPYKGQARVKGAIDRGVQALSDMQLPTGGYTTMGNENSESSAQAIIALTSLGIDPAKDYRFVKSDASGQKHSLVDALLTYKVPGGGFKHIHKESQANGMGTDQAMEALVALKRFEEGKSPLFNMKDVALQGGQGRGGKSQGAFTDLEGNWAKDLILQSKGYGIANGSGTFQPGKAITRGEFAVGLVQGLNLSQRPGKAFKDVKDSDWYAADIKIATAHEIIFGRGDGNFDPKATITRQEAFSMLARSLNKEKADLAVLDQFKDKKDIAPWAQEACSVMVGKNLVKGRPEGLAPKAEISRAEAVQLIHQVAGAK